MTCDDLMALKNRGLRNATPSLLMAMTRHAMSCPRCSRVLDAHHATLPPWQREANERLADAMIPELAARAARDPELPQPPEPEETTMTRADFDAIRQRTEAALAMPEGTRAALVCMRVGSDTTIHPDDLGPEAAALFKTYCEAIATALLDRQRLVEWLVRCDIEWPQG